MPSARMSGQHLHCFVQFFFDTISGIWIIASDELPDIFDIAVG
ncbi:MAG TPA: hypothetical protein VHD56_16900 [Tepidisphaeraceae bacterium]|nr:hypothetical protein [Tepidisphaeraceae bacterium]